MPPTVLTQFLKFILHTPVVACWSQVTFIAMIYFMLRDLWLLGTSLGDSMIQWLSQYVHTSISYDSHTPDVDIGFMCQCVCTRVHIEARSQPQVYCLFGQYSLVFKDRGPRWSGIWQVGWQASESHVCLSSADIINVPHSGGGARSHLQGKHFTLWVAP